MSEPTHQCVVIKAGGSLLARENGVERLRGWLASSDGRALAKRRVLLIGGGPVVQGLREIDAINPIPAGATHWAAIEILDAIARMLVGELPGFVLTKSLHEIAAEGEIAAEKQGQRDWLLAPGDFMWQEEPIRPGKKLPAGWETTSDSIAARVAICLGAPLVLLKSAWSQGEDSCDWQAASRAGEVDPVFPTLAAGLQEVRVRVL